MPQQPPGYKTSIERCDAPFDRREYEREIAAARVQLDTAEGQAMTLEQAIAYTLEEASASD